MSINASRLPDEKIGSLGNCFDAVDTYFECITMCSVDDGDCFIRCVQELKDND